MLIRIGETSFFTEKVTGILWNRETGSIPCENYDCVVFDNGKEFNFYLRDDRSELQRIFQYEATDSHNTGV